jgi:peptidoglycan/xylan/chitin deacetylase (PgdA/CDA1 family)
LDEIQSLSRSPNATIGSHGYLHNCLGVEAFADACREIRMSKEFLEEQIGEPVQAIAYPDGSYSPELVKFARDSGFSYQLAVSYLGADDGDPDDLKERFGINPFVSWDNQRICLLEGSYYYE